MWNHSPCSWQISLDGWIETVGTAKEIWRNFIGLLIGNVLRKCSRRCFSTFPACSEDRELGN